MRALTHLSPIPMFTLSVIRSSGPNKVRLGSTQGDHSQPHLLTYTGQIENARFQETTSSLDCQREIDFIFIRHQLAPLAGYY
jgi:hypothetical protein